MTVLSQNSAIGSGHDLWVLPHYKTSSWTPQIDWLMNFQILKTSRHISAKMNSRLIGILKMNEIQVQPVEIDTNELLIPTPLFFSNRWILYCSNMMSSEKEVLLNHWFKTIFKHWTGLQSPTMRIFLPYGVGLNEAQKSWSLLDKNNEKVAFVIDASPGLFK
jgi:hypothetical protein